MDVSTHSFGTTRWLRFSPAGELLSFAWPKERNQRKSHPCCVGLRLPCDARRPGRRGNSPLRAQTPRAFLPRPAALLGDTQGASSRAPAHGHDGSVSTDGRLLSPSALPIGCAQAGRERNRVRVPQHGAVCAPCQGELVERPSARAKSGTRRAAMWGRLSLVTFFGETKKVTCCRATPGQRSALCAIPRLQRASLLRQAQDALRQAQRARN